MNAMKWILKDGAKKIECTSFPYAFRTLWNIRHRGLNPNKEKGDVARTLPEMMKSLSITGPVGTSMERTFSFTECVTKARDMDLLDRDNNINSREFKKR